MARIRTIKPDFFRHEALFEAERASRLPLRIAFAGLWTVCDREGRFRWQPRVLKLDVLPFDDCDFAKVLAALVQYGFVIAYEVSGEKYAHIPSWAKHQQVNTRESASVIPAPDEASASMCMHMPKQVQGDGEGKGREGVCTEQQAASVPQVPHEPPPVAELPLADGSERGVSQEEVAEWSAAFPGVDVPQQLREMRAWLLANPKRRKTRRGVTAFAVSWLGREQDKRPTNRDPAPQGEWLRQVA